MKEQIAYCGLDCEKCDARIATIHDDDALREKGEIETAFGQTLSWPYLCYAREHPLSWSVPTHILYGGRDAMTSYATISAFAGQIGAALTVMENGEHWFHTEAQMQFLDGWIESTLHGVAENTEETR